MENAMLQKYSKKFFVKFDTYFMENYFKVKNANALDEQTKINLFEKFYSQIKSQKIASKPTIKKWFGLNGEGLPSRNQLIKLAFALSFDSDKLNDYLINALSEPEIQVNDYREFMAMYCLDANVSYEDYELMMEFFENKYDDSIEFKQTSHTNELYEHYTFLKNYTKEDFLVWTVKNMELFKGYSMITHNYFVSLIDRVYDFIRNELMERMFVELSNTDFYSWLKLNGNDSDDMSASIYRYIKNALRRKNISEDEKLQLREIRYFANIVYSPRTYVSTVVSEIFSSDEDASRETSSNDDLLLRLNKYNSSYISNLLNISKQQEERLSFINKYRDIINNTKSTLNRELMYINQRIRQIQRLDLLIPIQYIAQRTYMSDFPDSYNPEMAKDYFINQANTILQSCGMRPINDKYEIDYIMLECYCKEEMYLFFEFLSL